MSEWQILELSVNLVSANATAKLRSRIGGSNKNRIVSYFTGKPETIGIGTTVTGQTKIEAQLLLEFI